MSLGSRASRSRTASRCEVSPNTTALAIERSSPSPRGAATALARRGVRVVETVTEVAGKDLVIVIRDLHRQPENRLQVDALLSRRPDAVVVEMGVPVCRPKAAKAYIATYGSARVCADAAAELMTG